MHSLDGLDPITGCILGCSRCVRPDVPPGALSIADTTGQVSLVDGGGVSLVPNLRAELDEQAHLIRDLGTKLAAHREQLARTDEAYRRVKEVLRELLDRDVPDSSDTAPCHYGLCERSRCLRCQRVDRAWELLK